MEKSAFSNENLFLMGIKHIVNGGVTSARGYLASSTTAGIKKSGKPDLALLVSEKPAYALCATTTNRLSAAPVKWCRKIAAGIASVKGVLVNSGNANAGTGDKGWENCVKMAETVAQELGCNSEKIFICSTGVIGRQLPIEKIVTAIPLLKVNINDDGGSFFAKAIMTTDLVTKECAVEINLDGKQVIIGGCCKGSGMIHPNMATMLAFVTTDAAISKTAFQKSFNKALSMSFNRITVDGDTSTNDTLICLANGFAGNDEIIDDTDNHNLFTDALTHVFTELAKMIVLDGEGATKFVKVMVEGAPTEKDADAAARSIANSPLVKTALFGNDPNWGRIMAAVGYSGSTINPEKADLTVAGVALVKKGEPLPFDIKATAEKMKEAKNIDIIVNCNSGKERATIYTCDLSYDYVKINAEYTT